MRQEKERKRIHQRKKGRKKIIEDKIHRRKGVGEPSLRRGSSRLRDLGDFGDPYRLSPPSWVVNRWPGTMKMHKAVPAWDQDRITPE